MYCVLVLVSRKQQKQANKRPETLLNYGLQIQKRTSNHSLKKIAL